MNYKNIKNMPVIGVITIKPIGLIYPNQDTKNEATIFNVVEVLYNEKNEKEYITDTWYKEFKKIPLMIHEKLVMNYEEIKNEDACATGVAGMGNVVAAQPSLLPGATIGSNYSANGGTVGSGDLGANLGGVYQKSPTGVVKKKKKKKSSINKFSKVFDQKQDYTHGSKVMNFKEFINRK
jgi:hypothetical protein